MSEPAANAALRVIILGGCNGSGKTINACVLLSEIHHIPTFVNLDVIAQGLAGLAPESAMLEADVVMLERLRQLADRRER